MEKLPEEDLFISVYFPLAVIYDSEIILFSLTGWLWESLRGKAHVKEKSWQNTKYISNIKLGQQPKLCFCGHTWLINTIVRHLICHRYCQKVRQEREEEKQEMMAGDGIGARHAWTVNKQ